MQPAPPPAKQPTEPVPVTPDQGAPAADPVPPREIGGREGPDPTRYGDWEKNGRCIDF
ncbi:MAG: DUF1674 domain-containing protein [Aquimonas sp.]|nr:DUF1674 domain-containing protein [Aquimonas sp.]